jgi:hypothetical protein
MKFNLWKLFKKPAALNDAERFFPLRIDIGARFISFFEEYMTEDPIDDILELYDNDSIYSDITL